MIDTFSIKSITFVKMANRSHWIARVPTPNGFLEVDTGVADAEEIKRNFNADAVLAVVGQTTSAWLTARIVDGVLRPDVLLREAIEEWIEQCIVRRGIALTSAKRYRSALYRLFGHLPSDTKIKDITRDHIENIINGENSMRLAQRDILLRIAKGFFKWALNEGLIARNPTNDLIVRVRELPLKLKAPIYRKPWKDEWFPILFARMEELAEYYWMKYDTKKYLHNRSRLAKLLEMSNQHAENAIFYEELKYVYLFCRYLGLRVSDAVAIEWDSILPSKVNDEGKYIILYTKKTCKQLRIEPPPIIKQAIQELMDKPQRDPKLVLPVCFNLYNGKRSVFNNRVRHLMRDCNINADGRFHCLRVAYAVDCMDAGMSPEEIARHLTHSSVTTTINHYLSGGVIVRTPYQMLPDWLKDLHEARKQQRQLLEQDQPGASQSQT